MSKQSDNQLKSLLAFVDFVNVARSIERVILLKNSSRYENDAEHTFQLALIAWFIVQTHNLKLNIQKVLMYSLCHDLVEIYAGDTYLYGKNTKTKEKREAKALIKIKKQFPEFPQLIEYINQYEAKEDKESKYVYALDKLAPILNIYLDNGRIWKEKDVSLQMLLEHKTNKISLSPDIDKLFKQLVKKLANEEQLLFPNIIKNN
jgi:putative hydrolases of HD superfamily